MTHNVNRAGQVKVKCLTTDRKYKTTQLFKSAETKNRTSSTTSPAPATFPSASYSSTNAPAVTSDAGVIVELSLLTSPTCQRETWHLIVHILRVDASTQTGNILETSVEGEAEYEAKLQTDELTFCFEFVLFTGCYVLIVTTVSLVRLVINYFDNPLIKQ